MVRWSFISDGSRFAPSLSASSSRSWSMLVLLAPGILDFGIGHLRVRLSMVSTDLVKYLSLLLHTTSAQRLSLWQRERLEILESQSLG